MTYSVTTNFVGAKNFLKSHESETTGNKLTNEGVKWAMNVPSTPHFGGIWGATVKSMKFHMKRVIRSQISFLKKISTTLVEIKMVLNSRPLVAVSDDTNDFSVITRVISLSVLN
ncbi:uncharacterized protein NPIL_669951 [Nephila pilipes]|uniref:Uncharacterized protein n=1 Tax=Nephila pilipes TaxID=299642 RepID=A0A8X6R222_NEPPI|nr:uncharacterized protein NPIL_669951 [Nephila pilipes]